jgi:pimeloyl-ACP methyl ester carboxylesterase
MVAIAMVLAMSSLAPMTRAQTPVASPSGYESSAAFTEAECPVELGGDFVVGENQVCGTVNAPLVHDDPSQGEADIFVTHLKSSAETPGDPIVVLTGGPGQSSSSVLPLFTPDAPLWLPWLEHHDVILFDQRGTGRSTPSLACSLDKVASGQATPEPGVDQTLLSDPGYQMELLGGCGDELRNQGIDLEAFNSRESAADVVDVVHALGYERVNLYGVSYGSYLGQVVLRDHPQVVNAATLASPLPLDANVFSGQTIGFDDAVRNVLASCEADAECAETYPDLEAKLGGLIAQIREAPLEVTLTDPSSGQKIPFPVDVATFTQMIYFGTFVSSFLPLLPAMISQTADGDTTILESVIGILFSQPAASGTTQGVLFTFFCNDEVPYYTRAESEAEIADANIGPWAQPDAFTDLTALTYPICEAWNLAPAPTDMNDPVTSDVPTLIVTGAFDPITPATYGEQMLPGFDNGFLVNVEVAGHDPLTGLAECGNTVLLSFFDDPELGPDTSCLDDLAIDWTPDLAAMGLGTASPEASPAD